MRRVIANSLDDFTALALVLQGVYRPSATAATTAALGGLAYSLALPALIAYVLLSQDSHTSSLEATLLLALAASGPAIGYLTFVRRASTFLVEQGSFACNVPLGLGSWRLPVAEIASIELAIGISDPVLLIRTHSGTHRGVLLRQEACHKLKALYPWLRCGNEPILLPPGLRWVAYSLLLLACAGAVAVVLWVWSISKNPYP